MLKLDTCFRLHKLPRAELGVKPWCSALRSCLFPCYSLCCHLSMKVFACVPWQSAHPLFLSLFCICSHSRIPSSCATWEIKSCHAAILQGVGIWCVWPAWGTAAQGCPLAGFTPFQCSSRKLLRHLYVCRYIRVFPSLGWKGHFYAFWLLEATTSAGWLQVFSKGSFWDLFELSYSMALSASHFSWLWAEWISSWSGGTVLWGTLTADTLDAVWAL